MRSRRMVLLLCLLAGPARAQGPGRVRRPGPGMLPGKGQALAGRFLSERFLARGPRAGGRVGDYFVRSQKLLAVIRADDGVLVDLALGPSFVDRLGWGAVRVCDSRGVHDVHLEQVTLLTPRRDRRAAVLLRGVVLEDRARLEVSTLFHIPAEGRHLELTTTLVNRDTRRVWRNVGVCDHLGTGNVPLMVPGVGLARRAGEHRVRFCGRDDGGVSTVLAVPRGAPAMRLRLDLAHPVPAFDPSIDAGFGRATLKPGGQLTVRRVLALSRGGLHAALATALAATGEPTRSLTVTLPDKGGRLVVRLGERSAPYLVTDVAGTEARLALPRKPCSVSLWRPGVGEGPRVTAPADQSAVQVAGPAAGRLRLVVSQDGAAGRPAKLLLTGAGGTPAPDFGRSGGLRVENVIYSARGEEELALAPGRYQVTATRGPGYSVARQTVSVRQDRTATARLPLQRLFRRSGWVAADLHVHTAASFDSPLALEDRLVAAAAVGLHVLVLTDHNVVSTPRPGGGPGALLVIPGQEVTTDGNLFGHFNVFPLRARLPWRDTTPSTLFQQARRAGADVLVQVNHPRMGSIGYFDQMGLDSRTGRARAPGYDGGFQLLEVLNGDHLDRPEERDRVVADWLALLVRGERYVATGGSDSHRLPYQDAGVPRMLVLLDAPPGGPPDAGAFLAALRAGRAVVSTGPRVELTVDGKPVGSRVKLRPGGLALRIRVEAAPHVQPSRVELWERGKRVKSFAMRGTRFERTLTVKPTRDTFYTVIVRGERPDPTLWRRVPPFALTNPVWVEVK